MILGRNFASLLVTMTLASSLFTQHTSAGPIAAQLGQDQTQDQAPGSQAPGSQAQSQQYQGVSVVRTGEQINILIQIPLVSNNCSSNSEQNISPVYECSLFTGVGGANLQASDVSGLISQQQCQKLCAGQSGCVAYELRNITVGGIILNRILYLNGPTPGSSCAPCSTTTPVNTPEGIILGGSSTTTAETTTSTTTTPTTTPTSTTTPSTTTPTTTTSTASTTPTTTTPTTTVITTTTTVGTTTPLPASAAEVSFSLSSNTPVTQTGPVVFNNINADFNNHYSNTTNQFVASVGGIYYVEVCTGVSAGQPVNLRVVNSAPLQVGLTWDATIQNGVQTLCRPALVQVASGAILGVNLDNGTAYTDNNGLLSFTTYSITNSMSNDALARLVYAVAPMQPAAVNQTITPMKMQTALPAGGSQYFKQDTATYTCSATGLYIVFATAGVLPGMATQLQISNSVLPLGLTRTTTKYDGVTTLSRITVVQCQEGQTIQYNLVSGTTVDSDNVHAYNLTTFAVIPYEPRTGTPYAWAVFKWYISYNNEAGQGPIDPFYFSNVTVNTNGIYNTDKLAVTAPVSGYYYVNLQSGAGVGLNGDTFVLALMKGSQQLFAIEHKSTEEGATDMFSHGEVIYLNEGEVLRVVAEVGSYLYSSITGYEVQWNGFLLYQTPQP